MDTPGERRQCSRVPFATRVTVTLPTHPASVPANLLDISIDGVRLICSEPVSEGENALLPFQLTSHIGVETEEQILSHVVHSRMDDDTWVVRLKFNEALDRQTTPLLVEAAASQDKHA